MPIRMPVRMPIHMLICMPICIHLYACLHSCLYVRIVIDPEKMRLPRIFTKDAYEDVEVRDEATINASKVDPPLMISSRSGARSAYLLGGCDLVCR